MTEGNENNYLTLGDPSEEDLSHIGQSGLQRLCEIHQKTPDTKTLVFMRHSARHYGQAENDLDNPLSDIGRQLSEDFGKGLPRWRRFAIASSPSGRCVETAELICKGHDHPHSSTVSVLEDLAVFYVKNMRKVGGMIKHLGGEGALLKWLAGEVDEAWMDPPEYSFERLLGCVRDLYDKSPGDQLTLCVSHDWNLYLLSQLALGIDYQDQSKAEYLDCIVFYENSGEVFVADRHLGHRSFSFDGGVHSID